jgi:hypothetical protein
MQADVLVLHHHAARLEVGRHVEILGAVQGRRGEAVAQLLFLAVGREGDAVHRADVDAGIAFDAEVRLEHRLDVAVEAALCLEEAQMLVEAELDLEPDIAQRLFGRGVRDLVAKVVRHVVVVRPLVDAHLLRRAGSPSGGGGRLDVLAGAQAGGIETAASWPWATAQMMFLGPKALSPPKNTLGLVDCMVRYRPTGIVPGVELEAGVALDPGKRVLLADRRRGRRRIPCARQGRPSARDCGGPWHPSRP